MSFFTVASHHLLLLAQATTAPIPAMSPPQALVESFVTVKKPLILASDCIDRQPKLGMSDDYDAVEDRFIAALDEAEAVWPEIKRENVYVAAGATPKAKSSCGRKDVTAMLKQASDGLAAYSQTFAKLTAKMRGPGLWVGSLQLCKDNVQSAAIVTDAINGQPALSVRLRAAERSPWTTLVARADGRPLAIRLDGKVVGNQSYFGGAGDPALQITRLDKNVLTKLAERAAVSCSSAA